VRAEWPELPSLSYGVYYEVAADADPIGNDIGVNQINNDRLTPRFSKPIKHDNGANHLVIGNDYGGGGGGAIPINNDNSVATLAWPKLITNGNGGGAK
jgi:hypothetical protein